VASKAAELREAFVAEFGEAATQTRTGLLLGFEQQAASEPEPE
jgi:hypothetical protein